MIDLKKYSWLLILIGGILVLLAVITPSFGFIEIENGQFTFSWIFGLQVTEDGIDAPKEFYDFLVIGLIGAVILIIIASVLIVSAILTIATDIELPMKEYVWILLGIIVIILPFALKTTIGFASEDIETAMGFFLLPIDLFTLYLSFGGLFGIIAGLQEIKR